MKESGFYSVAVDRHLSLVLSTTQTEAYSSVQELVACQSSYVLSKEVQDSDRNIYFEI